MKIYHKFLLYQNKWIHPYVRMTVGVMTSITYLASILLIVGVVYEHGFYDFRGRGASAPALVPWGVDWFFW